MKIDYENKSVTSKYLIDIDGCFVTEKNILRCASTLGGEFFSFNPNLNEYYLVEINDGDLDLPFVDHFINSSIGQCEKID